MSHTTYNYTRERLGFDPDREERRLSHYAGVDQRTNGHNGNGSAVAVQNGNSIAGGGGYKNTYQEELIGGIYEENLSKFKGLYHFL